MSIFMSLYVSENTVLIYVGMVGREEECVQVLAVGVGVWVVLIIVLLLL